MSEDHKLGLIFLRKVDLLYVYMRTLVRLKYITSADFIVPNETESEPQLMGFHL